MTTLLNVNRVKYQCSCGTFKSLCYLYFCRHCLKIKCKDCVILEVNSFKQYISRGGANSIRALPLDKSGVSFFEFLFRLIVVFVQVVMNIFNLMKQ